MVKRPQQRLRRQDRKRSKKTSNREWGSKTDEDARIARIKDGRTRLTYKSEHVTDLETGAIVSASIYPADAVDTQTLTTSLENARDEILSVIDDDDDNEPPTETPSSKPGLLSCPGIIADKGYCKTSLLVEISRQVIEVVLNQVCLVLNEVVVVRHMEGLTNVEFCAS